MNLYGYVGNDSVTFYDALGLCKPFKCGPDITAWLVEEMHNNTASDFASALRAGNERANRGIVSGGAASVGGQLLKLSVYMEWIDRVRKGQPWDFKTFLDPNSIESPELGECPAERCKGFLTICGECYAFDIVANIHYGYVGKASGFTDIELKGGAGVFQIIDNFPRDLWDPPQDSAAIDVGIRAHGGVGLCEALKNLTSKSPVPRDCSPCTRKWAR